VTLFDSMVADFRARTTTERDNAIHEAMQEIALAGLSRGGFFEKAVFCGGTCLHLFHGLDRFSEDLDFSLLAPDRSFRFEPFFDAVREEFRLAGKQIEILAKRKSRPTNVESAFLKETSDVYDIGFSTEKRIKVKLEVDVLPPPDLRTEMKLLLRPSSRWIRAYDLPGLFAGKVHAVLFRKWKTRIKGRDWYDFAWYVARGVALDLPHLRARAAQTDPDVDLSTPDALAAALDARIDAIDFAAARLDVEPFVSDPSALSIWSRDYFKAVVRQMKFAPSPPSA